MTNLDPKTVIQHAYEEAAQTGERRFVVSDGSTFRATADAPENGSHWVVEPNGDFYARFWDDGEFSPLLYRAQVTRNDDPQTRG